MYSFNGISITELGCMPAKHPDECLAISGVFDMPKRVGDTEYNWGTSIEPFVEEEDIILDGRQITLIVLVEKSRVAELKQKAIECRLLGTDYGSFNVVLKGGINEEIHGNTSVLTINFWQPTYNKAELTTIATQGKGIKIDNYNLFSDFGVCLNGTSKMSFMPERIEVKTTEFYDKVQYRNVSDVQLSGTLRADNMGEAYRKMMQFQSLCLSSGVKTFTDTENKTYKIYFKDGMRCKAVIDGILTFNLKIRLLYEG